MGWHGGGGKSMRKRKVRERTLKEKCFVFSCYIGCESSDQRVGALKRKRQGQQFQHARGTLRGIEELLS